MPNLIFFTQHPKWGSSLCRANIIADKLGVPCDPPIEKVTKNHTVVMVKKVLPEVIKRAGKVYCDIVDGASSVKSLLLQHPEVKIITMTPQGAYYANNNIYPNHSFIWLPHQHCNDEKQTRPNRKVNVIGYNGAAEGFPMDYWQYFKRRMEKSNFIILRQTNYTDRKALCDFYMKIDIAVSYRLQSSAMKGPAKLNNAGSFRIPTVALPEPSVIFNYDKSGCFVPVDNIHQMVHACLKLRNDKDYYNLVAQHAYEDAQQYHIDNIIENYEVL